MGTIDADTDYEALTFYGPTGNDPIWTIKGPLSGDMIAGMLVAIDLMLDDLVLNFRGNYGTSEVVISSEGLYRHTTVYLSDYEGIRRTLTYYWGGTADLKQIIDLNKVPRPDMYAFGWWVNDLSAHNNYMSLIALILFRGFITICSAFGVDFRDYILGGRFTYHDYLQPPVYYDIEGYDIATVLQT